MDERDRREIRDVIKHSRESNIEEDIFMILKKCENTNHTIECKDFPEVANGIFNLFRKVKKKAKLKCRKDCFEWKLVYPHLSCYSCIRNLNIKDRYRNKES